jgi:hypothetical protein
MIVYADSGGGRFGNQLLRFFHWAAWVRELGPPFTVLDLPFWPYAPLFAEWRRQPVCVYPPRLTSSAAEVAGRVQSLFPDRWRARANVSLMRGAAHLARRLGALGAGARAPEPLPRLHGLGVRLLELA